MATDYGRDTSCTTELVTGRLVRGARLLGEAAYRRLTTPRGMLRGGEEEADYGIDLSELIGSTSTKSAAAALPDRIRAELKKDERFESVDVRVVETTNGVSKSFEVFVEASTAEGPFTLAIAASDVTVELLGIEVES